MSFVLGSDRTRVEFGEPTTYHPDGLRHAVDLSTAVNAQAGSVGYALCGAAVHVWPLMAFDPDAPDADEHCRALARAAPGPASSTVRD